MSEELIRYSTAGKRQFLDAIIERLRISPMKLVDISALFGSNSSNIAGKLKAALILFEDTGLIEVNETSVRLTKWSENYFKMDSETLSIVPSALWDYCRNGHIIDFQKIRFDNSTSSFWMLQSDFPYKYALIRNTLLEYGLFSLIDNKLLLSSSFIDVIESDSETPKGGITPEELAELQLRNIAIGEEAEQFVLRFEKKRLGDKRTIDVKQVSTISVSAGYDIASINIPSSTTYNRLIEVKAISKEGFHLSSCELNAAKQYEANYWLYLVDLQQCYGDNYEPVMIQDPYKALIESGEWRIEPTDFTVKPTKLKL